MQSSSQYTKGLKKIVEGNISLLNDDLRFMVIDGEQYTPHVDNHEFLSNIPLGARVASSSFLTGKTFGVDTDTLDDIPEIFFTCSNASISGSAGISVEAVVLYKDTGDPSTSPLISYFNGQNISILLDGGTVDINIGISGLMRWKR